MNKRIIYEEDGQLKIIIPSPFCDLSVEEIARKDVPSGLPYLIVSADEISDDRTSRNEWTADFSNPHGYGIGPEAWFAEQKSSDDDSQLLGISP